jgi:lipopolysaccharide export LptBFGC system permease protein LptF
LVYILTDFVGKVGLCVCAFLAVFLIAAVLDDLEDLLRHDAGVAAIVRYFMLLQPLHLVHALPTGTLLATLLCIGSFCRHRELTASLACGVSPSQFNRPIWLVAVVCTLLQFGLSEFVATRGLTAANRLKREITDPHAARSDPTATAYLAFHDRRTGRDWFFEDFSAHGPSRGVTVTQFRPDRTVSWELRAAGGQHTSGHWQFTDCSLSKFDDDGHLLVEPPRVASELVLPEVTESPRQFTFIRRLGPNPDSGVRSLLGQLHGPRPLSARTRAILTTELWRLLCAPLTLLVAAGLGLRFGVILERNSALRRFLLAGLLFAGYTVAAEMLVVLGRAQMLPALVAGAAPAAVVVAWALIERRAQA